MYDVFQNAEGAELLCQSHCPRYDGPRTNLQDDVLDVLLSMYTEELDRCDNVVEIEEHECMCAIQNGKSFRMNDAAHSQEMRGEGTNRHLRCTIS